MTAFSTACDADPAGTTVGRGGGEVAGEGARAVIPAGALSMETTIQIASVSQPLADLPAGLASAGVPVAFTPHGTVFAESVQLEIPHDGTATMALRLDDESDTTWEMVTVSSGSPTALFLSVDRFSIYRAIREGSADGGVADAGGPAFDAGESGPCDGLSAGMFCGTVPDNFEGICLRSTGATDPDECVPTPGCGELSVGDGCLVLGIGSPTRVFAVV